MVKITYFGHSCFQLILDYQVIVIDPYKDNSVPGLKIKNKIPTNFYHSSHSHNDHNATEKVQLFHDESEEIKHELISLYHDKNHGKDRGLSVAHIFYTSDYSICHLGDAGDVNDILQKEKLKNIDIILAPINGFYTISAEEVVKLKKEMNWKIVIPMHYEIKQEGIGYPDGGQIDIFKELLPNYLEIDSSSVVINEDLFKYDALIFKGREQ